MSIHGNLTVEERDKMLSSDGSANYCVVLW